MATEKLYSRVAEAEEIVKTLCEKYPDVLWCVRPQMVAVYGIENKERSEKCKVLAKIKAVKGVEKAIMKDNNIPVRYAIDLYWSDWREWKEPKRQWIIFHELLHIHSEVGKAIKHDCEDFRIILDKIGVMGYDSEELPNLIINDVKFNLDLRPSMEEVDEEDKMEIDEDEAPKKRGRPKKVVEEVVEKDAAKVEDTKATEVPEAPEEMEELGDFLSDNDVEDVEDEAE
jgi:hypothetical protein